MESAAGRPQKVQLLAMAAWIVAEVHQPFTEILKASCRRPADKNMMLHLIASPSTIKGNARIFDHRCDSKSVKDNSQAVSAKVAVMCA
jgi:hypothetical protein